MGSGGKQQQPAKISVFMQACSEIDLLDFGGTSIYINALKVAAHKRQIPIPLYMFYHRYISMQTTRQTIIHLFF